MKKILFLSVIAFSLNVFAVEIPEFMVGNWDEASRNDERDKLTIKQTLVFGQPDPYVYTLVMDQSRQVGREGDADVPYETLCRYRYEATATGFQQASEAERNRFIDAGKKPPTYSLNYQVSKVRLLPALFNSPNCGKYIERENIAAAAGELQFTWYFTDMMDDVLIDPWYGTVFIKR
ncbi:MAG: hypothetical protein K0R29_2558 [Pseudobdellovibrio sp.]|jgi:hypothetical protein|nr:hypothetical protein [Pseudobdellovibrio sp.]